MKFIHLVGVVVVGFVTTLASMQVTNAAGQDDPVEYSDLRQTVLAVANPAVKTPDWVPAGQVTALTKPTTFDKTYSVETVGVMKANVAEFRELAAQTLSDPRGWMRTGARFHEIPSGGEFKLTLVEAAELPKISSGCDALYSCRVGTMVLINQDRWLGATPSWNAQKGTLRDYRHMVINHEVGHWLGHGHEKCSGGGQPAPVMQQQSIDLEGCKFNPWPLDSEIAATGKGATVWNGL